MKTISYREYACLKQQVQELGWVWHQYQQKWPDGWYEFKYQPVLRHFSRTNREEFLLSQVHHKRFFHRVKMPNAVYLELKELANIRLELQDVLDNPPYGSQVVAPAQENLKDRKSN